MRFGFPSLTVAKDKIHSKGTAHKSYFRIAFLKKKRYTKLRLKCLFFCFERGVGGEGSLVLFSREGGGVEREQESARQREIERDRERERERGGGGFY